MNVGDMVKNWDGWAATDPMWAILTDPSKTGQRWDPAEFFETGEQFVAERMKWFQEQHIGLGRGRALDFGCGVGRLTNALGGYFDEAHGVDISAGMVARARELCRRPDRVKFFQNPRSDLATFETGAYDFVFSCIALQHIPSKFQLNYIGDFMRLLNEGGVAWFQTVHTGGLRALVPNRIVELVRSLRNRGRVFIPMYAVTRAQIEALCVRNGCRLLHQVSRPPADARERFIADVYVVGKGATRKTA